MRGRLRRADDAGRRVGVAAQHPRRWRDFPLRARLAERHRAADVRRQRRQGAGRSARAGWAPPPACADFIAMVVSTGVGGGIVLDGRLLDGAAGNAGHIGHVIVEPERPPCGCGARGCLEAEASGTAIAAVTGRPAGRGRPGAACARTGTLVGRAVASVANLLDLRLAVVAGSVALGFGDAVLRRRPGRARRPGPRSTSRAGARIVPAGLGAAGPLVGAAAVAWRQIDLGSDQAARGRGGRGRTTAPRTSALDRVALAQIGAHRRAVRQQLVEEQGVAGAQGRAGDLGVGHGRGGGVRRPATTRGAAAVADFEHAGRRIVQSSSIGVVRTGARARSPSSRDSSNVDRSLDVLCSDDDRPEPHHWWRVCADLRPTGERAVSSAPGNCWTIIVGRSAAMAPRDRLAHTAFDEAAHELADGRWGRRQRRRRPAWSQLVRRGLLEGFWRARGCDAPEHSATAQLGLRLRR